MNTNKKNPEITAKEKLLRFLKSKAYPVIPVSETRNKQKKDNKKTKDVFIDQVKKSLKGPCIFVHFPEEDDYTEM